MKDSIKTRPGRAIPWAFMALAVAASVVWLVRPL